MRLLLLVYERRKVRHKDLAAVVSSRGTLSYSLRSLLEEGLVAREVRIETRPVESYYAITRKGERIAYHLKAIREILSDSGED